MNRGCPLARNQHSLLRTNEPTNKQIIYSKVSERIIELNEKVKEKENGDFCAQVRRSDPVVTITQGTHRHLDETIVKLGQVNAARFV